MAGLERRVHAIAPVRGSTCGTLRYAPSSVSKLHRSSDPLARLPPPNCGRAASGKRRLGRGGEGGRTPPRRACALGLATPQSRLRAAIPRGYWCEQTSDEVAANEASQE